MSGGAEYAGGMDFDQAMGILARAAGDDLVAFYGEPRPRVSEEAVLEAARAIASEMATAGLMPAEWSGSGGPAELGPEQLEEVVRQVKADAFEAHWWTTAEPTLTNPVARAALIAFIEERSGRALPLEPPAD